MGEELAGIPVNEAEAVIVPFWSWAVSDLKNWRFEPGPGSGAEVSEPWAHTAFSWARPPLQGPAFRLTRRAVVNCTGYDRLVVRAQIPKGAALRLRIATDRGPREQSFADDTARPKEFAVELDGSVRLTEMVIEVEAGSCAAGTGSLYWLMLASTAMLERYHARWERLRATDWSERHVKAADPAFSFTPAYGIFLAPEALENLRAAVSIPDAENPFLKTREALSGSRPESDIADYLGAYWEILTRDRDSGRLSRLIGPGSRAALAGLVLKDAELLRLAARYALSLAACEHWTDGFPCEFHGCEFETRAFGAMYAAFEIAVILDLAGGMFTYWGLEYLKRKLAERALGPGNYVSWRWDYIHACNQMALFSPGRIGAHLVLEREWTRMRPYTDLAVAELNRSLETSVLPDGSYVEGPGYLSESLQTALTSLLPYARARGVPPETILPPALRRTADFVEAFMATDESCDFLATHECGENVAMCPPARAVLAAAAMPDSHWVTVYHKARARQPEPPTDLSFWSLCAGIPAQGPRRRPFIHLPEGGFMSSLRFLKGEPVRLFIMGNRAKAGHCHEDKGSFILEFAGDTFAMDSNCYRYDTVYMHWLKQCDRHNMLVPFGAGEERARPSNPIPVDVKPEGHGDETAFHARIDATPGWEGYYTRWVRSWSSPAPHTLEIHDTYELARGDGVEFLWNTRLPIRLSGRGAVVEGRRGRVRIEWPAECRARVEELPGPPGRAHNRLAIRKTGQFGELRVTLSLELKENR